jgi:NADH dehydrogenase
MLPGKIAVFGGTGFIGRHLVPALARNGASVRVAVRHPEGLHGVAVPAGNVETVRADVGDELAVAKAVMGSDAVVNLVGVMTETTGQTYRALHVEGARSIAMAARRHGVARLVHVSALGADRNSPANSDRTKAEGELAVRAAFPEATVVRPSLVFGDDDHFFNRFAAMAKRSPVLPLIGGGTTRFQPVSIGDVTAGLVRLVARADTARMTYEFGGPEVYSFREILELMLAVFERRRFLLSIPFSVAEIPAAVLELLPMPPLTRDQVRLLKTDKVVSGREPTLDDLGIHPTPLREYLPLLRRTYA